jgi:mannose-6-phosphate isomerase-like protein (cupin superfamily)
MNAICTESRERVRSKLRECMPDCPDSLVERFLGLLRQPAADIVSQASFVLDKPYGSNAIVLAGSGQFGLSFASLQPGQSTSFHYHRQRREFFCVHGGRLMLHEGNGAQVLGPLDCGHSTPHVGHRLENGGDGVLTVLEMFTPPLLDDKVRVRDTYSRALGPVDRHQ